jgi:hypothetical protein
MNKGNSLVITISSSLVYWRFSTVGIQVTRDSNSAAALQSHVICVGQTASKPEATQTISDKASGFQKTKPRIKPVLFYFQWKES